MTLSIYKTVAYLQSSNSVILLVSCKILAEVKISTLSSKNGSEISVDLLTWFTIQLVTFSLRRANFVMVTINFGGSEAFVFMTIVQF